MPNFKQLAADIEAAGIGKPDAEEIAMAIADDLAAPLKVLYTESKCDCLTCREARILAGRALIAYESRKVYLGQLSAEVDRIFGGGK